MGLALHTADIANPAKPRQLSLAWTEMCMEEFFTQVPNPNPNPNPYTLTLIP